MQEFFEFMNKSKSSMLDTLVEKYKSITPLLLKMESLVANTNTGRSPQLRSYYIFWEKKIFYALNQMIIISFNQLGSMFNLNIISKKTKRKFKSRREPLFKVSASLSAPEIILSPNLVDIQKMTMKYVRSILDSTKMFWRWQNGTCILTPPQKVADEEEPVVFSYYTDILSNANVVNQMVAINQSMNKTFGNLGKYLDTWRRYRPLWKVDKGITLEKFAQKKPSFVAYDEKLTFYSKLAKDVDSQQTAINIEFIAVSSISLQSAIQAEAKSWISSIGTLIEISLCAGA